jgi:hypothetical protein
MSRSMTLSSYAGGLNWFQEGGLKELEQENSRSKWLVANSRLDKQVFGGPGAEKI